MNVHLVDGTYEIFRHYFAVPSHQDRDGREVGAIVGVAGSMLSLIRGGATHVGVATDHVVESFRNTLWPGYKTGEGIDPQLYSQFGPLEETLAAMGIVVWPMVEMEADDGLASAAAKSAAERRVERVFICTPDKDLSQCVVGRRVVQLDRRLGKIRDAAGVVAKFGVTPESIPDYLALVGDSADGFPGLSGWGAKSASTVLASYIHLEAIPDESERWKVSVRGAARLASSLRENRELAALFRDLASLRDTAPVFDDVDELRWRGPTERFAEVCDRLRAPELLERARSVSRQSG